MEGQKNKTTQLEVNEGNLASLKATYQTAAEGGDVERIVTWSGQGVGLFNKILPAAEVVKEISDEAAIVRSKFPAH